MLVKVLTHIRNYALSCLLKNDRLNVGRDERYYEDDNVGYDSVEEIRELKSVLFSYRLNEITHNKRRDDLVRDRYDHKHEDYDKALGIGLRIYEQALDYLAVLHISVEADRFLFVLHKDVGKNEDSGKHADDGAKYQNRIPLMHLRSPPLSEHPRRRRQDAEAQRGCGSSHRKRKARSECRTRLLCRPQDR